MLYNPQTHPIHLLAQKLLEDFEQTLYDIVTERLGEMALTQISEIDLSLETFPLCNFPKTMKEETSSVMVNQGNGDKMNQETSSCTLTRRVSFVETDCQRERPRSSSMCSLTSFMNDEEEGDIKHQSENEEGGDLLPGLSRQDSTDSMVSMNDWPRRPDHITSQVCLSGEVRLETERKVFEKSQLGPKGVMTLMSELSRNVCRLKDDMYVITLSDVSSVDLCPSPTFPVGQNSENFSTTKILETSSIRGGKGKGKGLSVIGNSSHSSSSQLSMIKDSEKISLISLSLLEHIKSDTSDPDDTINSPFIDSRQTFLEMCQYRHYQFDSLRRAKASSVMLLYHLLYPQAIETRPICSECQKTILTTVRWHCTLCLDSQYDVCEECHSNSLGQSTHEHQELTPIRLTYF
jgi:hypothetical protein